MSELSNFCLMEAPNQAACNSPALKKRLTVTISPRLDHGLELYCAGVGKTKNQVVSEALTQFLKSRQAEISEVFRAAVASTSDY